VDVATRIATGLVLDGGLATLLERHGADLRDDLWSARVLLEDPDLIRRAHREYFAAGADVAITASYQASFEGFARRGLDRDEAADLFRDSVRLARAAADERAAATGAEPLVAASIGPYGAMLADGSEYDGRYGLDAPALREIHRARLETLIEAGPDLLAVETIPSAVEAEAMAELLREHPAVPAWVSFSCRDGRSLRDGSSFVDAAGELARVPGVVAVGVNCTPPAFVEDLLASAAGIGVPLVAYPNLGSTWDATAKRWLADGPRPDFGVLAPVWRAAGAAAIGGCCGTGPEDIEAIAAAVAG
jgi:homocysteine S-methyltransferase